ncbi:hypothetical protein DPV78_007658 [Talaromyces pinophilus]|nr:hypothetical protein DPV78_007658 [Talaromyces pinophilus]
MFRHRSSTKSSDKYSKTYRIQRLCKPSLLGKWTTYNTSIVLKVEEDTIGSSPGLALTDNNSGHNLLSQFGLSLLNSGHDHVANTGGGETVETGTGTGNGDDVQVASSGVVAAVHHGATIIHVSPPSFDFVMLFRFDFRRRKESGFELISKVHVHRQTESHPKLVASGTTTRHEFSLASMVEKFSQVQFVFNHPSTQQDQAENTDFSIDSRIETKISRSS